MPDEKEAETEITTDQLPHIPTPVVNPPYEPPPNPSPGTAGIANEDMPVAASEVPSEAPPPPAPAPEPKEEPEDEDKDNGDKRAARHSRRER